MINLEGYLIDINQVATQLSSHDAEWTRSRLNPHFNNNNNNNNNNNVSLNEYINTHK